MSEEERKKMKHTVSTEKKLKRNFTRSELSEEIIEKFPSLETSLKGLTAAKVKELAVSLSIPIMEEKTN